MTSDNRRLRNPLLTGKHNTHEELKQPPPGPPTATRAKKESTQQLSTGFGECAAQRERGQTESLQARMTATSADYARGKVSIAKADALGAGSHSLR